MYVYARPRLAARVAAYNGDMGYPKHGRVLEASRPALRACNRQFYGEGRVLGSHRGCPVSNSGRSPRTPRGTPRGRSHRQVRGRVVIVTRNKTEGGVRTQTSKITLRAVSA